MRSVDKKVESFEVGSQLLLSTSRVRSKTLGARNCCPSRWSGHRADVVDYIIRWNCGIHWNPWIFHVLFLKPYRANDNVESLPFVKEDLVERILMHGTGVRLVYLIKIFRLWFGIWIMWAWKNFILILLPKEYWDGVAHSSRYLTW